MKILIILIRWEGGVGRVVNSIKPLLEKAGHEVEVISREDDLGIKFNSGTSIRKIVKLRKEVKKRDYDILYTQDWSCALPFLFKKNHYCCHNGITPNKIGGFIQKIVGKIMKEKTISVGPPVKKIFPKSTLIYNGFNPNEFKDLKMERKYFGWVDKGTEIVTEEEMRKMAKERRLELSIAKKIPPEKMNEWYNTLKVFASYPSKSAGFNLVWIEALASGIPKVLGNGNGVGIDKVKKDWKEMTWENHVDKLLGVLK